MSSVLSYDQYETKKGTASSLHGDIQPEIPKYTWKVFHLASGSNQEYGWMKHENEIYVLISNTVYNTQIYASNRKVNESENE